VSDTQYELVEFRDPAFAHGQPIPETISIVVGVYASEGEAIAKGRTLWKAFRGERSRDVAWWIVRVPGEPLARWIAESASEAERALDLTTQTLVELHH